MVTTIWIIFAALILTSGAAGVSFYRRPQHRWSSVSVVATAEMLIGSPWLVAARLARSDRRAWDDGVSGMILVGAFGWLHLFACYMLLLLTCDSR